MGPTRPADLASALDAIFDRHRDVLARQVGDIEGAVAAAMAGDLDESGADLARREAHKLAGTGGMFGLHRTSALAREVELGLADPDPSASAWVNRMAELVVDLGDAVRDELAARDAAAVPVATPDGPTVVLVDVDEALAVGVAAEADARGIRLRRVDDPGDVVVDRPDVVVFGGTVDGGSWAPGRIREVLGGADDPVPMVLVTAPDDDVDRVVAVRGGVRRFLTMPLQPARVLDVVEEVLTDRRLAGVTVVAVDDDPVVLDVIAELLRGEGVAVETVQDPARVWEVLDRAEPDLLILDVDMPGTDGVELCRVVRSDARWAQLSILFLTGHTDADTVTAVFEAGADDYVSKPLNHRELVVRISNRLERIRLARQLAETDALTGAARRPRAAASLDRLLRRADRDGQPLSVAVVAVDDFRALNHLHGHATGDQVLHEVGARLLATCGGRDLVARWGDHEFLVSLPGLDRVDGVHRVADVLEQLREDRHTTPGGGRLVVTASAGVAESHHDAIGSHELYLAADRARRAAVAAGGDRVLPAGRSPDGAGDADGTVDVVLVEDDQALAAVLDHALQARGWTTRRIDAGDEAVRRLAGRTPDWRARVVVLDWDLPGLDGATVLRRLADDDVLDTCRVIMLTAHNQEDEVVRVLEQGAFDHVAKPFSVPVLIQRIRRALR